MDWFQYAILPVIGLAAGVLGGLLGIGGGLVIIPALLLILGKPFGDGSLHVYKLAALLTAVGLSIPAARQHFRAGAVVRRMLPAIAAFGVFGVCGGVWAAKLLAGPMTHWLQRIFGVVMIAFVVAGYLLARRKARSAADRTGTPRATGASCPAPSRWGYTGLWVGLPAGVIAGLLGVGGGVWAVPVQELKLHLRLPSAIANSTCMVVVLAVAASAAQALALSAMPDVSAWDGVMLAVWLAPGALVGGVFGGRLTHVLPVATLQQVFRVLLILTGVRLLM
ncbi:MAG: sulfite exporter TauE/SafE family protein [Phycisphaerales bacterium]|nr:sulfite exporter TauE/SafE family protein [Phycisphaerales bacterium]